LTAVAFVVSALASIGLGIVYWRGGQPQLEGALLAAALGGIGVGIVVWAKQFMPAESVVEERKPLESTKEQVDAFVADFVAGEETLRRRRLLLGAGGAALAAFGAALLFPIRSLGPRPGKDLKVTSYAGGGRRVVTDDGMPVRPGDVVEGGVVTVWPEGHVGAADSPTLLIRPLADQRFRLGPRQSTWVVDRVVAYSKLCTHTGCPVGLYQAGEAKLLCPCHQSTFDVLDGARPVFGPAARALPQLPLELDDDGYIVASGDFADPIGPGFWDRGR
jgi:ubiquinol-cytochrome c reductase iron-sulfur subunit